MGEFKRDIRYCPVCGYFKAWWKKEYECPVCGTITVSAEELNTGKKWVEIVKTHTEDEYVVSQIGHELDPEMVKKRIQFEEDKNRQHEEWVKQREKEREASKPPVITCPYCKSTDTSKISTASKAAHAFFFGIFSISRNSKQWHCNKCHSDF